MPSPKLRTVDRELRRTLLTTGDELRRARLNAGLRQVDVSRAVGCSVSSASRAERGLMRHLRIDQLLALASVVGLVGRVGLYPAGRAIRDLAQTHLLDAFRRLISPVWRWETEIGMPIPGDLRAWDARLSNPACTIGVEALTRVGDVQAQTRAALLKARDSGVDRVVILVRDTNANRRALHEASDLIRGSFPLGTRAVLEALRQGRDPGGNGIVLLDPRR